MDKIEELLTRGVDTVYPSKEELEKVLRGGKKLRIYQGFDPTGTQLHIGHMIGLRKLRQWQKAGHHVIFLIGDITGTIGDPTGKDKARKPLTREQVLANAKTYKEQASKILDFDGENPIEIKFNSEWLGKMSATDFMNLTSLVSYNEIIERDMFQERIKRHDSIGATELIYPILQGYDSVAMDVDLEVGGTDQLFNMLMGRQLMQKLKGKEKFVMTTPLLTDSEGRKIGKSEENVIGLTDDPAQLFGKIMALPDDVIVKGLEYLTDVSMTEIKKIEQNLNPVEHKKLLAFEVVKQLNGEEQATPSQEYFESTVQKGEAPRDIPEHDYKLSLQPRSGYKGEKETNIVDLLVETGLASSNSDAKRLVEQGGVEIDEERIMNHELRITVKNGMIVKVGKRKFLKLKLNAIR